ncbi:MAG TPA: hypothetical protein DCQ06_00360, partial [Myxococcales bacterium]|nr:hypothetical protein [Myxococcales bacterium]
MNRTNPTSIALSPRWSLCILMSVSLAGCDGCSTKYEPPPVVKASPIAPAVAPVSPLRATADVQVAPYRGPTSKNQAGYSINTGFRDEHDEAVSQPTAVVDTQVVLTP